MEHRRILSVCRSNVVRSEMFRQMMEAQAQERGIDIVIESAGVEDPPAPGMLSAAQDAMRKLNYTPKPHTPRRISPELVNTVDIILCFSDRHIDPIKKLVTRPDVLVETVHSFAGVDQKVVDPRNRYGRNWVLNRLTLFDLDIKLRQVDLQNPRSVNRLYLSIAHQINDLAKGSLDKIAKQQPSLSLHL